MFRDRRAAGRELGDALSDAGTECSLVLGLARGGMPVAAEVARALGAPLDVLVVRKVGCPWQPELAIGAVGEGGGLLLDQRLISELAVPRRDVIELIATERRKLEERKQRYRSVRGAVDVRGQRVVVADDGIATGTTAALAVGLVRQRGAASVVLAVPVAARRAMRRVQTVADDVVCLHAVRDFHAVSRFYEDFRPTPDREVIEILASARGVEAS